MTLLAASMSAFAVGYALSVAMRVARFRKQDHRAARVRSRFGFPRFQFWVSAAAAGAMTFSIVWVLTGLPVVALVPALVVATFPQAYYSRRRARLTSELLEAWPDGLRDLVSSVRAGSSLLSAIETLGRFGPGPLRRAFANFGIYARSLGVEAALEMIRADLADPTSDRVIEVLLLAHERGGSAVPAILDDLAEATSRDVWATEQIRTEALEQKINSRVVFALPWLVLVAMTARSGPFREFYSSSAGVLVVALGGLMSLVGIVIAIRVGSSPGEPRVFTGVPL